jgi:SAM-dependent methyltransferase
MSEYKQENRARWAGVATGWEQHVDGLQRDATPVSMWMVDAIEPQPGHTVLEIAAGLGDTGFLAAELIAPGGTLITSDLVAEMLSAAQRRAERLGISNVRFRQIDAEAIDQPAASLDGVLCRWGYMLMPDAEAALKETRRILKPGGRVALAAWADPDANPWSTVPVRELVSRGLAEPIPPGPGQYAWAEEGVIAEQLEGAGFVEYEVHAVDFAFRHPSVGAWWDTGLAMSQRMGEAAARMSAAEQEEVVAALAERVAPYTSEDGSLALPARTWVAAATA